MNFSDKYDKTEFLNFLQNDFLPEDFVQEEEELKPEFKTNFIEELTLLGEVPSLSLKVYEARHKSEHDPRVSLTREIFRLMANYATKRALVIFVSEKSPNYRFSLVTLDLDLEGKRVKKEFSNPKRYSFFLGPDAKTHTPNRFLAKEGRVDDFEDLLSRFNVEVVTKEFFNKYKDLFDRLSGYLKKDRAFQIFAQRNKIDTDNFAKKLLGQVVFLYFLQRKGWLGAKKGDKISNGDKDFLRNLFNKSRKENLDFFNEYLEPLFYNALNTKSEKAGSFYREYFDCQIPFLNGGLFEPLEGYDWEEEHLNIPSKLFSSNPEDPEKGDGILDIFDLYNFTVHESDPIDKEVSIDPEMLGKVFENLLEENLRKGKGTYYTPREIVHYMCQESLIYYLTNETGITEEKARKLVTVEKAIDPSKDIKKQVKEKSLVLSDEEVEKFDNALQSIKVCDPACGSGAFLVGTLQLIVKTRMKLTGYMELFELPTQGRNEYDLKKEAIQSSIYGVDIDPGAVEIAQLRLWLSLVVDYELDDIEPLPNLDYKIMVGNSLIEILSPNLLAQTTDQERNELINKFNREKDKYFSISDTDLKRKKRAEINLLAQTIVNYDRKKEIKEIWDKITGYRNQTHLFGEEDEQPTLAEAELSKELKKLEGLNNDFTETDHFEWHLNFNEIFEENGGFDVVIANPPYIGESGNKEVFRPIAESRLGKYHKGKMDIFYYFFHLALNLTKNNGTITFITTNYFITATGASKLREDFKKRASFRKLLNFNNLKLFDSAKGQHNMITILNKESSSGNIESLITQHTGQASSNLLNSILNKKDNHTEYFELKQDDVFYGEDNFIRLALRDIDKVLDKITKLGEPLATFLEVNQGVVSGCDYVSGRNIGRLRNTKDINKGDGIFVFDLKNPRNKAFVDKLNANEKKFLRPFYKNSDIRSYWCSSKPTKMLLYSETDFSNLTKDKHPHLLKHFEKFKTILSKRLETYSEDYHWTALHRPREERLFLSEKIVVPYRSGDNAFGYNNIEWFCRSDCYLITSKKNNKKIQLKYILALLNSTLYYNWFYYRGKRKGQTLELFYEPLSKVPILIAPKKIQGDIVKIVDNILKVTSTDDYLNSKNKQSKVEGLKKQIDQLVYELYKLSPKEIKIVEKKNENS